MIYWGMDGIKDADCYRFLSRGFHKGTALPIRMERQTSF
jgi:hypothetical protein